MNRGRVLGPGRLEKRGRIWTLSFTDAEGKPTRKGLSTDKRTAERLRSDLIAKRDLARAGLGSEAGQEAPLAEIVEAYLTDLAPRVSPRHASQVRSRLEKSLASLGEMRVRDLRPMHAIRLRSEAQAAGVGNRTANQVVTSLQAALKWAAENELIASSPITNVKKLPESAEHRRAQRRAMTDEEIERFLTAAATDDEQCELIWSYPRVPQLPLWLAFLETGARYAELTQTSWGAVDLSRGLLELRAETTKSKKSRVIPLRQELVDRIRSLKMFHETVHARLPKASERVFLSPEGAKWPWHSANLMRIFNRVLESAGIQKVTPDGKLDLHALRHTFASRLARNGVPLVQTQRLLGHSDPSLTAAVYTHVDAEDLRGAVNSLSNPAPSRLEPQRRDKHG